MRALEDLIELMQGTEAAIARLETAAHSHPGLPSVRAGLESWYKRRQNLQAELAAVAHESWVEVCRYRHFREDGGRPGMASLASALLHFQDLLTFVYDAVVRGPRKQPKITPDVVQATELGFAYSYSGSVGFALTLPSQRVLLEQSDLDRAMATIVQMAQSQTSDQIAEFARKLGPTPIRKMYRWLDDHVRAGSGTDIRWMNHESDRTTLFMQTDELERLQRVIKETSEPYVEQLVMTGQLVGADVSSHTFHMEFERAKSIKGKMAERIGIASTVQLRQRYTATIIRTTVENYSLDADEVSYHLVSLDSPVGGIEGTPDGEHEALMPSLFEADL